MRTWIWPAAGAAAVLAAIALAIFEPWTAFIDNEVDEELPPVAVSEPADPADTAETSAAPTATPSGPTALSRGAFVDAEHATSGMARILEYPDGRRYLRLEGLDTSNGPDLHVWLSDAAAGGSWFKYDDGDYLRLGELKANKGNQNYPIPADADLSEFRSAVIWCDRFNVAFGAAPVRLAG